MDLGITVRMAGLALLNGMGYAEEYWRRRQAGELSDQFKWYGWLGARDYLEAIARGDVASQADIDSRRGKCEVCPWRRPDPKHPKRMGYCGPMFAPNATGPGITCGCPIEMATCVASRACPDGQFTAVLTVNGKEVKKS